MAADRPGATARTLAWEVLPGGAHRGEDSLASEEPLEIRLLHGGARHPVAVTMRTPGADFELAVGFMFSEGILRAREQLRRVSYCVDRDVDEQQRYNIVNVELAGLAAAGPGPPRTALLGHQRLRGLRQGDAWRGCAAAVTGRCRTGRRSPADMLRSLPAKLRRAQRLFETTGGLHAAGSVHRRGRPGRPPRGRRAPQRGGQAGRLGAHGRQAAPGRPGAGGQRALEFRARAEVSGRRGGRARARCRLRAASPWTWPASSGSPWWGSCARTGSRSTAARKGPVWPNAAGPGLRLRRVRCLDEPPTGPAARCW